MADSTNSGGPFRLTPPDPRLYATGAGEQQILQGIKPETMASMYPFLINQRAQAANHQYIYGNQLRETNRGQQEIAGAKLAHDDLVSLRKTGIDLIKEGGVDVSNVAAFNNSMNSRQALGQTDMLRRMATQANSFKNMGEGLRAASDAGAPPVPGQSFTMTAEGLAGLAGGSTDPTAVRTANIAASASRANSAASNSDGKIVWEADPQNPTSMKIRVQHTDPVRGGQIHSAAMDEARRQTGAAVGPKPGDAPGAGGPPRSIQDATAKLRAMPTVPAGTRIGERPGPGGRSTFIAYPPGGQPFEIK